MGCVGSFCVVKVHHKRGAFFHVRGDKEANEGVITYDPSGVIAAPTAKRNEIRLNCSYGKEKPSNDGCCGTSTQFRAKVFNSCVGRPHALELILFAESIIGFRPREEFRGTGMHWNR